MTTMMMTPKIWIGNLGRYNEGYLIGEWISLPCTPEELDNLYTRIGINEYYEEIFIADIENCYIEIGEFDSIPELNEMAQVALKVGNDKLIKAVFEYESVNSAAEAIEILETIEDDYYLLENINSHDDYGFYYVENHYEKLDDFTKRYLDYEAIGRDCELNEEYTLTEYGALIKCR